MAYHPLSQAGILKHAAGLDPDFLGYDDTPREGPD
jgi:hypothetical protein